MRAKAVSRVITLPVAHRSDVAFPRTVLGEVEEAQCSIDQAHAVLELVHDQMLRQAVEGNEQEVQALFAVFTVLEAAQKHLAEALRVGQLQ